MLFSHPEALAVLLAHAVSATSYQSPQQEATRSLTEPSASRRLWLSLYALGDFTVRAVCFCKGFLSSAAFEVLGKMEIIRHMYFHWHREAEI